MKIKDFEIMMPIPTSNILKDKELFEDFCNCVENHINKDLLPRLISVKYPNPEGKNESFYMRINENISLSDCIKILVREYCYNIYNTKTITMFTIMGKVEYLIMEDGIRFIIKDKYTTKGKYVYSNEFEYKSDIFENMIGKYYDTFLKEDK